jgi:hypothetical protein
MKDVLYIDSTMPYFRTDAPLVAIKRGESGYHPIYSRSSADELNGGEVSAEVIDSAVAGSMFGWHVPAAAPAVEYFEEQEV